MLENDFFTKKNNFYKSIPNKDEQIESLTKWKENNWFFSSKIYYRKC